MGAADCICACKSALTTRFRERVPGLVEGLTLGLGATFALVARSALLGFPGATSLPL